jgi:hypothetical protein
MKRKNDLRLFLQIISLIVLLAGLGLAVHIYRSADHVPRNVLGYEEGGGVVYPDMPDDSKKYLRDMELYGGKANVLMDQFRRWFIGVWHGKSLALIIAGMAVFLSVGIFYIANRLSDGNGKGDPEGNSQGETPADPI